MRRGVPLKWLNMILTVSNLTMGIHIKPFSVFVWNQPTLVHSDRITPKKCNNLYHTRFPLSFWNKTQLRKSVYVLNDNNKNTTELNFNNESKITRNWILNNPIDCWQRLNFFTCFVSVCVLFECFVIIIIMRSVFGAFTLLLFWLLFGVVFCRCAEWSGERHTSRFLLWNKIKSRNERLYIWDSNLVLFVGNFYSCV